MGMATSLLAKTRMRHMHTGMPFFLTEDRSFVAKKHVITAMYGSVYVQATCSQDLAQITCAMPLKKVASATKTVTERNANRVTR